MSLIKCKECSHEISKSAKPCPSCGANVKKTSTVAWFFLLLIVVVVFVSTTGESPAPKNTNTNIADSFNASWACKKEVKSQLKAPSSAVFPTVAPVNCTETGCYSESYVDARNSFGAQIRQTYACLIKYEKGKATDENSWSVKAGIF